MATAGKSLLRGAIDSCAVEMRCLKPGQSLGMKGTSSRAGLSGLCTGGNPVITTFGSGVFYRPVAPKESLERGCLSQADCWQSLYKPCIVLALVEHVGNVDSRFSYGVQEKIALHVRSSVTTPFQFWNLRKRPRFGGSSRECCLLLKFCQERFGSLRVSEYVRQIIQNLPDLSLRFWQDDAFIGHIHNESAGRTNRSLPLRPVRFLLRREANGQAALPSQLLP